MDFFLPRVFLHCVSYIYFCMLGQFYHEYIQRLILRFVDILVYIVDSGQLSKVLPYMLSPSRQLFQNFEGGVSGRRLRRRHFRGGGFLTRFMNRARNPEFPRGGGFHLEGGLGVSYNKPMYFVDPLSCQMSMTQNIQTSNCHKIAWRKTVICYRSLKICLHKFSRKYFNSYKYL